MSTYGTEPALELRSRTELSPDWGPWEFAAAGPRNVVLARGNESQHLALFDLDDEGRATLSSMLPSHCGWPYASIELRGDVVTCAAGGYGRERLQF